VQGLQRFQRLVRVWHCLGVIMSFVLFRGDCDLSFAVCYYLLFTVHFSLSSFWGSGFRVEV